MNGRPYILLVNLLSLCLWAKFHFNQSVLQCWRPDSLTLFLWLAGAIAVLVFFLCITMSSPVYSDFICFQQILFPKERIYFKWFPYLVHSVTYTHCLNCYLMKTSINHMRFFIACNEHTLNCRSALAFTYIHLSIIFHSLFHSDNAWPSTSLNRFLHVFIGYDRHILYFCFSRGRRVLRRFSYSAFYPHLTTISIKSWS